MASVDPLPGPWASRLGTPRDHAEEGASASRDAAQGLGISSRSLGLSEAWALWLRSRGVSAPTVRDPQDMEESMRCMSTAQRP